jgi:hypothetical protein
MSKVKRFLKVFLFFLGISILISGIGFISYKIWRAEHPNAPTWTFFVGRK